MDNLNEITRKYFDFDKQSRLEKSKQHFVCESADSVVSTESFKQFPQTLSEEYSYQSVIRPLFGKTDINNQGIGAHPDFSYLENTDKVEMHYIATMFVDIKGSTRLNLLLDLEDAFYVKNRILQAAIDVVRSLDGHPHRLMGDALMAFFGGKGVSKECAIADAINACAMLRLAMTESVFPQLDNHMKTKSNLAIRVGIDFGDDQKVLWACYGFGNATEVTAQGLNVDCASKLQSKASSNHIMMGENITSYIDFPDQYTAIKEREKDGSKVCVPFLEPNITDEVGKAINYRMYHLNHNDYINLLPIPTSWKQSIKGSRAVGNSNVSFRCEVNENGQWKNYESVSRFLVSGLDIRFIVKVPTSMVNRYGGLTVKFTKKNNGQDAGEDVNHEVTTKYIPAVRGGRAGAPSPYSEIILPEGTKYRGLHTMNIDLLGNSNSNIVLFSDCIGVYIYGES